jgi:hypothetical protein
MDLHRFTSNFVVQLVNNDTKLATSRTPLLLPHTVSKMCLHDLAIKPTAHSAEQNTQTGARFKANAALKQRSMYPGAGLHDVSTQKQNSRRPT